jgi:hypothetical protein
MKTIVRYGVILGVLVEIWTFVMIATGWHRDPASRLLFFMVIPLQVTALVMALRQTSASGAIYGKQIVNGIAISLIGAAIVFVGLLLMTTVVFPHYLYEQRSLGAEMIAKAGRPAEEIEAQLSVNADLYDPLQVSFRGFVGTMLTGAVVTAITGFFVRKR